MLGCGLSSRRLSVPVEGRIQGGTGSQFVLDFFEEFDIPIYVLYGMSESTGPQTFNYEGERVCVRE